MMDQSRFIKDLNELKEGGYVKKKDYLNVLDGYYRYREDIRRKETANTIVHKAEAMMEEPEQNKQPIKTITPPSKQPKVKITAEQRRERNITSIMAVGVIMLLLGGLTLATSNWDVFSSFTKTMLVGGIAVLFGGFGALSEKVLQIRKTAFTFFVLFALFIPITVLSAGYFELFGDWLSFYGEGRFILGVMTAIVCTPIYYYFGLYFKSKLFSWITYVAIVIGYAYLILSFGLTKEAFYFVYAAGNIGFILLYHYKKGVPSIFLQILPLFIQANLILSTLFILILFENQLYQSFNIILTAALYLSMRMVNQRKEYELFFIGFITYGLYQLIQNSLLVEYRLFLIVIIPIVFVVVANFSDTGLKKYYQLANGVISILAFLYITVEGVMLSVGDGSVWLLLGYLVLAGNFIFLSYNSTFSFFKYLAPFYLFCAFMEVYHLSGERSDDYWTLAIGISSALSYSIGQYLKPLNRASLFVGGGGLLISFLLSLELAHYGQGSMISVILTILSVRHFLIENGKEKMVTTWLVPIFTFFTFCLFGMKFLPSPTLPYSLLLGSVVTLIVYLWQRKQKQLATSFVSITTLMTTLNFLVILVESDFTWIKILSSIFQMVVLWFFTKHFNWAIGFSGIQIALFFALSYVADLLGFSLGTDESVYAFIIISFLLLINSEVFHKFDSSSEYPMKVVSHLITLLFGVYALLVTTSSVPFILLATVYGVYLFRSRKEYEIRYNLYVSLIFLAIGFQYFIRVWLTHEGPVVYSVLLAGFYFVVNNEWRKRLRAFIVPFSVIFLGEYITIRGSDEAFLIIHAAVLVGFIVFYQSLEKYWKYASVFLLIYFMIDLEEWLVINRLANEMYSIAWFTSGILISLGGMYFYKKLYSQSNFLQFDFYAVFGMISVLIGLVRSENFVTTFGLVILAILFYVQGNRLLDVLIGKRILQTCSSLLVLFSYYSLLDQFEIPVIIQTELIVLPWILLSYVITRKMWGISEQIANLVQYVLLGVIGITLMIDAIDSYQVMDAIILGSLSFASIIYGFISKQKSYFFTGLIVLLLNVLVQTRPYWGNMPWWVYLLLTGIFLIGFASYNEFKKQKGIDSPPLKDIILIKWKHWFGEWK
ncbi:hypothetical protein [Fictibacillus phosphorivorans]|uniref:hypothetical protein n=1 Tax=Fictibacillus phosphorivorans TaxID=1221500 RepID=UPI0012CF347C|nr:hypothetical protein [Fictibacillus phosphorivorans]MQR96276.1 hypothetical protein [Fictibacillus phosphorivorans]